MTTASGPGGRLTDRDAILEAMALYARAVDDGDFDALAEIFNSETVWIRDTGPIEGLPAIIANLTSSHRGRLRDRHIVTNVGIRVAGDSATAVSDWYLARPGNPWTIVAAGRYQDHLRRIDGRWMFARREIQHLSAG